MDATFDNRESRLRKLAHKSNNPVTFGCLCPQSAPKRLPAREDGKQKSVLPLSTAEYNLCGLRAWFNGTTITLGVQNVFDAAPPFVAGACENNYDESIADIKGRFWYVQLKKRF
jgi:hypothetical protein